MTDPNPEDLFAAAAEQLGEATKARKCWDCACFTNALDGIESALPLPDRPPVLQQALTEARAVLQPPVIECRGCEVCFPPLAINFLSQTGGDHGLEISACPAEKVEVREGWPPYVGSYTTLRFQAPVAVCTLTDESLADYLANSAPPGLAIVGTMQTENLGIERLIENILANPNIRFLIVCGEDSRRKIGHLPGASIAALAKNGVNERMKIIEAPGKRPLLKNISLAAIEHFRKTVEIIDMVGNSSPDAVLAAVTDCLARDPGPALPLAPEERIVPIRGQVPDRMISDPAGYFVVYVDRRAGQLSLEHFHNEGVLNAVIVGQGAAELYCTAIERGLLTRLDHAAYLGKELARAEACLLNGETYIQDAAPEAAEITTPQSCGCTSGPGGKCG